MDGPMEGGMEGVLAYLRKVALQQQPFCLVVSLVNPHDVLFYPKNFTAGGYDDTWLPGNIEPPGSAGEDLSTKPRIQSEFLKLTNLGLGQLSTTQDQRNYLIFYGNLMKLADAYLIEVLNALDALELTDQTLVIRTADHGEMGLTHGGARQKCFNFYEPTINIPLVYSNPLLFPTATVSKRACFACGLPANPGKPVRSAAQSPFRLGRRGLFLDLTESVGTARAGLPGFHL